MVASPTTEPSGQAGADWSKASGEAEMSPISASVQPWRPSAAEGLRAIPSGRVTTARFRSAWETAAGSLIASWGSERSTSSPEGESASRVVGVSETRGSNGTTSQPSVPAKAKLWLTKLPGFSQLSTLNVVARPAGVHEVGKRRKAAGGNPAACGP